MKKINFFNNTFTMKIFFMLFFIFFCLFTKSAICQGGYYQGSIIGTVPIYTSSESVYESEKKDENKSFEFLGDFNFININANNYFKVLKFNHIAFWGEQSNIVYVLEIIGNASPNDVIKYENDFSKIGDYLIVNDSKFSIASIKRYRIAN